MACLGYAIFEQDTRLIALLGLAVIFDKFDDSSLPITQRQPLSHFLFYSLADRQFMH